MKDDVSSELSSTFINYEKLIRYNSRKRYKEE